MLFLLRLKKAYCKHLVFAEVTMLLLLQTLEALNTWKSDIGIAVKVISSVHKVAS